MKRINPQSVMNLTKQFRQYLLMNRNVSRKFLSALPTVQMTRNFHGVFLCPKVSRINMDMTFASIYLSLYGICLIIKYRLPDTIFMITYATHLPSALPITAAIGAKITGLCWQVM